MPSLKRCLTLTLLASLMLPALAEARIKLITLPVRERVEIQLDHPNATLVEEERIVPLVKGVNQVDFSWANTQIDPNTIVFRVLPGEAPGVAGKPNEINVLSVSYPPGENALVWQVGAAKSGSAHVRISYLLGGLDKSFSYRAVAASDEKKITLRQYVLLRNVSNESFGDSEVYTGIGDRFVKPIELNETKQVLLEKFVDVPVSKTYTCNPNEFGWQDRSQNKLRVPMRYVVRNDEENGLGASPLPFGKVRIFIADNGGNETFLGEDWGQFTPIDDKMELNLGVAQDIVVKRTIERNDATRIAGNLYDYHVVVKFEIENFKDSPVTLNVEEFVQNIRQEAGRGNNGRDVQWDLGETTNFDGGLDREESDNNKLVFHVDLSKRDADGKAEKITKYLHLVIRNEW